MNKREGLLFPQQLFLTLQLPSRDNNGKVVLKKDFFFFFRKQIFLVLLMQNIEIREVGEKWCL